MDAAHFLSVRDAARRAGVSPSLVYQWCTDGSLPHYRLGGNGKRGKIRIDPADLDALVEGRRVSGTPAHPPTSHIRV
ncbi:MAG: helix-turn-helix domain-containing protein [Gemmataceae bacterium]